MDAELKALREEISALRREVAELRAGGVHYHYHGQPTLYPPHYPNTTPPPQYWPSYGGQAISISPLSLAS